ncbi:E3 ubiquitin-protein ligase TRIM45-like [Oculina patagonica]
MESLLKNLHQQVTCSICLDTYNDPKTISCLHTFCFECLKKHALVSQRQGKFRCPECQARINLPEGNRIESLPSSFFHKSLLSLIAVRETGGEKSNITCANCQKTSSQIHYCFDCGRFLCSNCLNAHELLRVTFEGHKVTSVKDFRPEDYEALLKRQPFCSQQFHEKEVTRFFCLPCQSCVCHVCIVTDHRNHEVVLLDKAAHDEKDNIMAGVDMIKRKASELSEVIRQFENTICNLEINIATAKCDVTQAAEEMIAKIRERERGAVQSLEVTRVTRLEKINCAKEEVNSLIKQMNQAVEFADNLVQRCSSSDIMQNKGTLNQRFEELREVEVPKHQQTSFIKFTAASVVGLKLGNIMTKFEEIDTYQYTLEGLEQTLQAGVEAELILRPNLPEDEINNQADIKDSIEVVIEPTKDVTNLMMDETESGKFKVKFTPKATGAYSIEVKINGDKLSMCPVTVLVKERELTVDGVLDLKVLQGPSGIATNTQRQIAITDKTGHCVYIFDKEGNCLRKIGSRGQIAGQFNRPIGVTYLNDNEILIADQWNHRIQLLDTQTGNCVKCFGKRSVLELRNPVAVCLNEGLIVVTEFNNHRIHFMSKDGESIFTFGDSDTEKLNQPLSCIPYKNLFFVSDSGNHCVKVFDRTGTFLHKFGGKGKEDGQFNTPHGLLVDKSDNLLVCDWENHSLGYLWENNRVQQFSLDGRFTGKTTTHLPQPAAMATTPDGRILVTSTDTKKIYILK